MTDFAIGPSHDIEFIDRLATIRIEHDDEPSTLRNHAARLHDCGRAVLAALRRELTDSVDLDQLSLTGAAQVLFDLARAFDTDAAMLEEGEPDDTAGDPG